MAFVEPIGFTEINEALEQAFGERLRWQMSEAEYDDRIDSAAHAAAQFLNRPYFEDDLSPEEQAQAALAYAEAMRKLT